MPYRFIEEAPTADVGFVASGTTLADCFRAAAAATLAVMLGNPDALRHDEQRSVRLDAATVDLALLQFLEELVYYKDADSLFLDVSELSITATSDCCHVEAVLAGERIDPARHQLAGDVKAVTLHKLQVTKTDAGWEATVVLDV